MITTIKLILQCSHVGCNHSIEIDIPEGHGRTGADLINYDNEIVIDAIDDAVFNKTWINIKHSFNRKKINFIFCSEECLYKTMKKNQFAPRTPIDGMFKEHLYTAIPDEFC